MILRLVYSFFFFSLVTGNNQGNYEYAPKVSSGQGYLPGAQIETKSFDVDVVSDNDNPRYQVRVLTTVLSRFDDTLGVPADRSTSATRVVGSIPTRSKYLYDLQIPRTAQHVSEDSSEKTICFAPRMVRRIVKAALEYVSEIPADIRNIVEKLEKELNTIRDTDSFENIYIQKPLYPLDSRNIFQTLSKPSSEARNNLVLKYELPGVQEPQCKDALDKLIGIAYNAFLELEQHPQCRDYLYKFASHQQEDRPKGHLNYGPDMQSLVGSILEQIIKQRPKPPTEFNRPDYYNTAEIDIPIPEIQIPQIQEIREIHVPHKLKIPQIPEYHIPQIHEINIPQTPEINIPQIHEIIFPQIHEYNIPQIREINIPDFPKAHEFEIPNIEETIQEVIPMQPEETYDVLIDLLKNSDNSDNGDLLDRFMNIVVDNQNNFRPKVYNILTTLLNRQKHKKNPRLDDIILLILDSERKKQWPWSDRITELILSLLVPDRNGNIDSRIVDIILDLSVIPNSAEYIEYILSLLRPIKEGKLDSRIADTIIKLIKSYLNNLLPSGHMNILGKLLQPTRNGIHPKKVDIVDNLSRWNEIGITPNQLDKLVTLLKPDINGNTDLRLIDIIHFLITQDKYLSPRHLDFILSFLYPENGIVDARRTDLIHFLLNSALHPKHINRLLRSLQDNPQGVLNSRFLDLLLFLNNNRLLTPELTESIIQLLINDITGQLDDNHVKSLFYQLTPFKQTNPKLIVDILTLLNQGGLHDNIAEWLESTNNNVDVPNHDATLPTYVLPSNVESFKLEDHGHENQYRPPDERYQTDDDFMEILKWLDTQGLLNADQESNNDLVNNLLKILNMGERELGVVELTYMLKHEKPLIYQPVYYVKYRLPILNFIANMKNILMENPQLTADPMKLLQELILNSNLTEVSPNLQGYPKEEILKLTVKDGDLVQAKILDEQNLSLNEQITHVHDLNSNISPEELLQLNRINEAKYYQDVLQFQGAYPEKVTMDENKIMKFPTVQYQQIQVKQPITKHQTHSLHYVEPVERTNRRNS